jgi:hypothetical protein
VNDVRLAGRGWRRATISSEAVMLALAGDLLGLLPLEVATGAFGLMIGRGGAEYSPTSGVVLLFRFGSLCVMSSYFLEPERCQYRNDTLQSHRAIDKLACEQE